MRIVGSGGGAARALGEIRDPRAVAPLIEALQDKDKLVRWVASNASAKIREG